MIQANNICLTYGNQIIFDHVSFIINKDQRIGLVGRNGAGKSTLLKVLGGLIKPDDGSISIMRGMNIAYMPQEVVLLSDKTVLEEALSTFAQAYALAQRCAELEKRLDTEHDNLVLIDEYATVNEELKELNYAQLVVETKKVLAGLGFTPEKQQNLVTSLSVGWRMRLVLAKLLLQKADFYFFDEPTNHLDIIAKDWFVGFLKKSSFGFMLVCHERYFLNELCSQILEVERGAVTFYTGNYTQYEVQKAHNLELLQSSYVQQQKEIKRKEENIERFRYSAARSRQAQSMIKALDKVERIELPPEQKIVSFHFKEVQQPGRIVLTVKDVSQTFGDKKIFEHVNFEVERGEKVALIAPNGVGKTTLFNIIVGNLPLQHGSITLGYNVKHTIFAQDQEKILNTDETILHTIEKGAPTKTQAQIRTMLGAFLFPKDDVEKKVKVLSGGEKNRVSMVNVLMQDANFLLLDEPTNHLDMQAKDILLRALQQFNGTILFVSHDHDFINHLANRIIELSSTGVSSYLGNYESYLYHKKVVEQESDQKSQKSNQQQQTQEKPTQSKNLYVLRKTIKSLENKIERIEKDIKASQERLGLLLYGTVEYQAENKKLATLEETHKTLIHEWEAAQKELEA